MNLNRAYDLLVIAIGIPVFAVLVTRDPWGGMVTLVLLFVTGTLLPWWLRSRMSRAAARPVQVRRHECPTCASVTGGVIFKRRTGRRWHNGGSRV